MSNIGKASRIYQRPVMGALPFAHAVPWKASLIRSHYVWNEYFLDLCLIHDDITQCIVSLDMPVLWALGIEALIGMEERFIRLRFSKADF